MDTVPLPVTVPPPAETTVTTTVVSGPEALPSTWLHTNIRNLIACSLTVVVCYLALEGVAEARAVLVATFAVLAGSLWGERAALKVPNKDT